MRDTQRGSQSYMEKIRGKQEIEVTRRRRGGVKRTETDPASNQFPKCSPQLGTPKEIHRVGREEKGEGGDRGDLGEKKETQKGGRAIKPVIIGSVQFNRSVVSDSLQPHELQHTRPPCPSPTPGVHTDSRPSSQ